MRPRNDAGATLLLALLFLGAVGTIVAGIASWTSNDLNNTLVFQQQRNNQSALSAGTNVAIQNIRYTPMLGPGQTVNANPGKPCFGSLPLSQVTWTNPQTQAQTLVDTWCSTMWNPTSAQTRTVTISACLNSIDGGSSGTCAAHPGLQTQVIFDDYSSSTGVSQAACSPPPSGTCGIGMTIVSSVSSIVSTESQAPTIASLSSYSGPVTGGTVLTITGSNFLPTGMAVNFVLANDNHNLVLTGTGFQYRSPTSISVSLPVATTTGTYNVIVSDPNGVSGPSQYTYQPTPPSVSSVTTSSNGSSGPAAGGTGIKIKGTGFLDDTAGDLTTVQFVDAANPSNVYTAPSNSVSVATTGANAGVQITAATPAISSTDMTYYVVVTTAPGGSSGQGPACGSAGSHCFTYTLQYPVVASAVTTSGSLTQGGPGANLTVTGVGFISGSTTVQIVPTSGNGSTLTFGSVSVTGSTALTANLPSGGKANSTYYVVVTTPSGSSGTSSAPIFTYT